jgi:choline dehydrogenase-like flavoprotein
MVGMATRIKAWYGGKSDVVGVQVFGTVVPSEDSTVRVVDRHPPDEGLGEPLEVCLRYDSRVLDNMSEARDRFVEVFREGGTEAQPVGPFHDICPGSSFHYGGTLRMHTDPAFGVVDAWNRVHDARNVIVCDASCFTTGPEKNPTLTAMAIAARAARRLATDLAGPPRV